ncbi:CCA tRNA nucleotidyltransferase [uncultured Roseibium sp.]|uniref:CCA tRNA nucleotidyltransferase n=1 Tax=uncultured Roseibium sp. TaxID=1936171 RepID=UPI0032174D21
MTQLTDAYWLQTPAIQRVFEAVEQDGDRAMAVGGAIRNTLLGVPVADVDIATTALPEQVAARARDKGLKVVPTGIDHGTVTVISAGMAYEVTTLRQDVETFGRQAKVVFGTNWIDDARRRDFTLNALYVDRHGKIYDPLGGFEDCIARRVRFIGDPRERIREDYLRILRFFRIHAAYGLGAPDPAGLSACIRERDGLRHLSAERIGVEMKKLVRAPLAAGCLALMEDSGLLEITTGGISRIADFRALRSLDDVADETRRPELGFAVLSGFVDEDLDRIADRFRLSNAERKRMHGALAAATAISAGGDDPQVYRLLYRHGRESFIDGLLAVWAQARAGGASEHREPVFSRTLKQGRDLEIPVFPLKGADLMAAGLPAGPKIGETLKQLEEDWLDSRFSLSRTELLERVQ